MAMAVGIGFILLGVFLVIPLAGLFGVVWTIAAVAITVYHAVNVFTDRGLAHEIVDIDVGPLGSADASPGSNESTEQRLTKLESLRRKELLSDEEYEEQRRRILGEL